MILVRSNAKLKNYKLRAMKMRETEKETLNIVQILRLLIGKCGILNHLNLKSHSFQWVKN